MMLRIGVTVVVGVAGLGAAAPVSAAECTYTYNQDGFPRWSNSCSTVMSPGRFGPLRMGKTTVSQARGKGYLATNRFCGGRLDGVAAYDNWRRQDGKVAAWTSGGVRPGNVATTKGLEPSDSLRKAMRLYPSLSKTGFLANPYTPGEGWSIYSVRGKKGWLDFYVYPGNRRAGFFAVRANSYPKPIKSWSLDGC